MISTTSTAKRTRLPSLLLVLLLAAPAIAEEASIAEARAVVDQTLGDVLAVLSTPDLSSDQRRERIEAIAIERFDWRTISRLVLARNWKRFSSAQQEEFVELFKAYLSDSYGGRIERYDQQSVEIVSERLEPRGDVSVKTLIVGGEADGFEIAYRMRKRDGPWRVIDVVIEGVSIVSSFRSQFQEVVSQGGPEHLLEQLHTRTLPAAPDASGIAGTAAAS